jgi:hypothetical protein
MTFRMSNRHNHYHEAEIHEHRAPTDASVKLLTELEQAAEDRVVDRMKLKSGSLELGVTVFKYCEDLSYGVELRTDLNGKVIQHRFRMNDFEYRSIQARVAKIREEAGKFIADQLLEDAFTKDPKQIEYLR